MGPKYVIIKKGEHGAPLLFGEDIKIFFAPALPLEEVGDFDPTGAGDTFAGGFDRSFGYNTGDVSFDNMKRRRSFTVRRLASEGCVRTEIRHRRGLR